MALPSTLCRFRIALSDLDRQVYTDLDFRVAMHPSESESYLLTRVLAFALNTEEGLEFSEGLSDPEAPAIRKKDQTGGLRAWIEVGQPAARRLHKASKACDKVLVYCHKAPGAWLQSLKAEAIHRREAIGLFAIPEPFLAALAAKLGRDNAWTLVRQDNHLLITAGDAVLETDLETLSI